MSPPLVPLLVSSNSSESVPLGEVSLALPTEGASLTAPKLERETFQFRAQELCESRGGPLRLPVPNNPYGLCGVKATLN